MNLTTNYHEDLGQLLELAAAGDTLAFEHVYTDTAEHVYSVVKRILRDSDESVQAVQDVYVEIWSQLPGYNLHLVSPGAWIMAIAHHLAVDRLRRGQASSPSGPSQTSSPLHDAPSARPARPVKLVGSALTAMTGLTPTQREAIHLAYFEGLTTAEISTALDVDQESIILNIRDGLRQMTAWLNE